MQTKAACTASLLASIGLLVSTPSTIGTTGARDPALERDARALVRTNARVHRAIDRWRARGNPSPGRPPLTVELAALVQQRLVIRLTAEPRRAEAVLAHVRGPLRPHVVATVRARLALLRLVPPRRDRCARSAPGGLSHPTCSWARRTTYTRRARRASTAERCTRTTTRTRTSRRSCDTRSA